MVDTALFPALFPVHLRAAGGFADAARRDEPWCAGCDRCFVRGRGDWRAAECLGDAMRFFTNFHPGSLSNELRAYWIAPEWLRCVCIKIAKQEAEAYGGVYKTYMARLKRFLPKNEHDYDNELMHYEFIGALAEKNEDFYKFTSYFRNDRAPSVKRLPLPDHEELEKLGLV